MKAVVVVLLCVISLNGIAQDWTKTQKRVVNSETMLQVGDHIPFKELHNMINYPTGALKLSDHKAKLILLDFWATNCGPCIKFWPTALKLQEEFGPDLQIIAVNHYENSRIVKNFIAKRKKITGVEMTLPMSNRDSTIWKNFPLGSLPRYVWIGSDGVIGAITDGPDVTRENIKKWITSGPFPMTNIDQRKFHRLRVREPLFLNGNGGDREPDVFLWTSSLSTGQNDIQAISRIVYDSLDGYAIMVTNSPIFYMYGYAYNNRLREYDYFDFLPRARMQLIARDTTKYYEDGTLAGNAYNYQLISRSPRSRNQLFGMMQEDLKRYFGMDVKWEKQTKKCVVITMFDSTLATKRKGLASEGMMRHGKIVLDSVTVKDVTTIMEMGTGYYRDRGYPIVDETGYKGVITGLREDSNAIDPASLDKILSKFGFHIKFAMREVDVLVLREPEIPNNQGK